MRVNKWVYETLPNYKVKENKAKPISKNLFKRLIEYLFSSTKLNLFLLNFTNKSWRKKWAKKGYNMDDYDLAFKTQLNVSKNHPKNYQKLVLKHKNEK
jgi:hypothetical protein